jgi:hypothetical protein
MASQPEPGRVHLDLLLRGAVPLLEAVQLKGTVLLL